MKKVLVFLLGVMMAWPAAANLFVVKNVAVETVADSGVKAKEAAMADGQVQAFSILLKKMALVADKDSLPVLAADDVSGFVSNVVINSERTMPTKYIGSVNVQFKEDEVRAFLKAQNIPFTVQEAPRFLVVPVWQDGESTVVWGDENPMVSAIRNHNNDTSVFQFMLPEFKENTLDLVTEGVISGKDLSGVGDLISLYKATHVLWMSVKKDGQVYRVKTAVYPPDATTGAEIEFVASSTGADMPAVADKLMKKIEGDMEKNWRRIKLEDFARTDVMLVSVPLTALSDWARVRKMLDGVRAIDKYVVKSMKGTAVGIEISLAQPADALRAQLRQKGWGLVSGGDGWVLVPVSEGE